MRFLPLRDVGVSDSGAAVAFYVSSGSERAAPALARGKGPAPPTLKVVGEKVGSSSRKVTGKMT